MQLLVAVALVYCSRPIICIYRLERIVGRIVPRGLREAVHDRVVFSHSGEFRVEVLDRASAGSSEKIVLNLVKIKVLHVLKCQEKKVALRLNQATSVEGFLIKDDLRRLVRKAGHFECLHQRPDVLTITLSIASL